MTTNRRRARNFGTATWSAIALILAAQAGAAVASGAIGLGVGAVAVTAFDSARGRLPGRDILPGRGVTYSQIRLHMNLVSGDIFKTMLALYGDEDGIANAEANFDGPALVVTEKMSDGGTAVHCFSSSKEGLQRFVQIMVKQIQDPETGGMDPWSDILVLHLPNNDLKASLIGQFNSGNVYYRIHGEPVKNFATQYRHANRKRRDAIKANATKFADDYHIWIAGPDDPNNVPPAAKGEMVKERMCFDPFFTPTNRWLKPCCHNAMWPTLDVIQGWWADGNDGLAARGFQRPNSWKEARDVFSAMQEQFDNDPKNLTLLGLRQGRVNSPHWEPYKAKYEYAL